MAEIVDKYIIETQQAQANLNNVAKELEGISAQSKKTASQVNTDFTNAARGGQQLTKQLNGINLAVGQFARELPNAAISAQTFLISLTNQWGQLKDGIDRLIQTNRELVAQGKQTQSVFKAVLSGIFSLNTAISIGATLLVLYGKEIGNLISSLFKGTEAFNKARESLKLLNAAFDSKAVIGVINNVRELQTNIDLARKGFISQEAVLLQYNQTIGQTTGEVKNLNQAEQGLIDNGRAYVQMMFYKAAANAALEESTKKALEAEKLRRSTELGTAGVIGAILSPLDPTAAVTAQIKADEKQRKQAEKQSAGLLKIFEEFQTKAATIAEENGLDFLGNEKTIEANRKKAQQEAIEQLREFWRLYELEAAKVRPTSILPTDIERSGPTPIGLPDQLKPSLVKANVDTIQGLLDGIIQAEINGEKEVTKNLREQLADRLRMREQSAEEAIRLEKMVTDRAIELGQQISDGIFQLRSANAQAQADNEIRILEEQKEQELEIEGLSAEQREAIEVEFNQKRAAILNRNAQIQRQRDLSQILINTAIAVIRALATANTPIEGQILAALAAAEGAIQYGFAQSQPLPQFLKGTDRVRGGIKGQDSVHALLAPDEAVITANRNMEEPGLALAWNKGRLKEFLAMKYIEPALEEAYKKDFVKINNQFINNNRSSGLSDKRIVKGLKENTDVNRMILRKLGNSSGGFNKNSRLWN